VSAESPFAGSGFLPRLANSLSSSVMERLKAKAKQMGGDAVIWLSGVSATQAGGLLTQGLNALNLRSQEALSGTVIRFTDPECRN